jgi:hypothetical protein
MTDNTKPEAGRDRETIMGRVLLLAFGLGALGFLVAIDRTDWFSIQPATGTSIAMAAASASARDNSNGLTGTVCTRP